MKALVTGATGFIGSHLTEALIRRGYDVTCLIRESSNTRWIEHLDIEYIFCDLADTDMYADALPKFDSVFHVAGLTKASSEKDFFTANAENTNKLLRALDAHNTRLTRFVFLSSLAAVGPSSNGTPLREDSIPLPVSSYGKSKLEGEKAVLAYRDIMPVTILRPPAVYGPRDTDFYVLFRSLKRGIFPYWGKCYYSLLYVDDLIQGIILSAEKREAEGEIFFLSDGKSYTNDDIAREISRILNKKPLKLRLPRSLMPFLASMVQKIDKKGIINTDRIQDFRFSHWTCDFSKAKAVLGFTPRLTLQEGMQWTADWYKTHQWL